MFFLRDYFLLCKSECFNFLDSLVFFLGIIMNKKSFFAAWGLLFTACIWGFAFVVVKDSLNSVGPIWMMAFRFTIAAVGLALIFIKKLKDESAFKAWITKILTAKIKKKQKEIN